MHKQTLDNLLLDMTLIELAPEVTSTSRDDRWYRVRGKRLKPTQLPGEGAVVDGALRS